MRQLVFLFIFSFALISQAFAHPPSDIKVKIDGTRVSVDILHAVADPAKHYIYQVFVNLNGARIIEQKSNLQSDNNKQVVAYNIPSLKKGDKLVVWAGCIKGGDLSKEVKVD
ncbi:MAG: hypothetical protein ABIH27_07700 [Candidatus Omnitrophota bacterium]